MNKSGTVKVLKVISGLFQQKQISSVKKSVLLEAWKSGHEEEVIKELRALNTNEFWKKDLESIL